MRHVSVLACSLVLLCSCARYQCDPCYVGPKDRSEELVGYYGYPRQPLEANVERINEKKKYAVERIEFPSVINIFAAEDIRVDYYVQKQKGKFPTILILPISGGIDFSVRSFASYLASHGFNCAVVHSRKVELKDAQSAEQVEDYFRQTVFDSRQVLDYLAEREEVDASRFGCLGLSLGGIKASLIAAVDERVKCSILGLAGGSIADVALLSKEKHIKGHIKELVEMRVSPDTIHTELSEKVRTDPLKLAPYVDAKNVLMFIAAFDQIVPRKCGDQLRQALGKPETVYLFSGHYTAFLYLPYAHIMSLTFFKEKLGTE